MHRIEKDKLIITVNAEDQAYLQEQARDNPDFNSDNFMTDLLEPLVCNSELQWIPNGVTGDLTSAPMLGICGQTEPAPKGYDYHDVGTGLIFVGHWDGKDRVEPVLFRWAFMKYAITSVQAELARKGEAVFEGGELLHRDGQSHVSQGGVL